MILFLFKIQQTLPRPELDHAAAAPRQRASVRARAGQGVERAGRIRRNPAPAAPAAPAAPVPNSPALRHPSPVTSPIPSPNAGRMMHPLSPNIQRAASPIAAPVTPPRLPIQRPVSPPAEHRLPAGINSPPSVNNSLDDPASPQTGSPEAREVGHSRQKRQRRPNPPRREPSTRANAGQHSRYSQDGPTPATLPSRRRLSKSPAAEQQTTRRPRISGTNVVDITCEICKVKEKSYVLQPCSHTCCDNCARQNFFDGICFTCSANVTSVIKINIRNS